MSRTGALPLFAVLLALTAPGCGGGAQPTSTKTTTASPKPPPEETRDPLPERPKRWHRYVNERGGYALLLPRGWKPKPDGPRTLVRSYDRLVAISIVSDRSAAGLATPIGDYATATAARLRGFQHGFETKGTRPLDRRYRAVEVYGRGRSREGVEQKASVIVIRRDRAAILTVLLAANASRAARPSLRVARRAISTLRTRPPHRPNRPSGR